MEIIYNREFYPQHHNGYPQHHNGYPQHHNGYPQHHNGYPQHHNGYPQYNSPNSSNCAILILIVLIIIIIFALFYLCWGDINSQLMNKNRFASSRAIQDHQKSINILKNNPNAQYTDFKNAIPDIDAPKYKYIKQQYINGGLTVDDFDRS